MDNNSNKEREKIITFILGALLIIVVLAIIAIFSGAIMRLLGFEYESVGGFILYFIIASVVSYPINLIAGALPKALLNLDRITREIAVCMYVLLDTIATFYGFYIVDYFMPSVSANTTAQRRRQGLRCRIQRFPAGGGISLHRPSLPNEGL